MEHTVIPPKSGIARVAMLCLQHKLNLVIVPVAIHYPLGKTAWRAPAIVMFGDQISPTHNDDMQSILLRVHQGMQTSLDRVCAVPRTLPFEHTLDIMDLLLIPGYITCKLFSKPLQKRIISGGEERRRLLLGKYADTYRGDDVLGSIHLILGVLSSAFFWLVVLTIITFYIFF
jgi:hypothetical protein